MIPFLAIFTLTLRELSRAKLFKINGLLIIAIAILLPFGLMGDGSAEGLFRVQLTYVLTGITVLLSVSALGCGCLLPADDLQRRRFDLLLTKPLSRIVYLFARFCGIIAVHMVLLVLGITSFLIVLYTCFQISFPDGRHVYQPERPELKIETTAAQTHAHNHDEHCGHDHGVAPQSVRRTTALIREAETPAMKGRYYYFNDIPHDVHTPLTLRYRAFASPLPGQSADVTELHVRWESDSIFGYDFSFPPGEFIEVPIELDSAKSVHGLALINLNAIPCYLHRADGPLLLAPGCGFIENMVRATAVIALQIILFGIVGILFGAVFSSAAALISSVGYLALGWVLWFRTAPVTSAFGTLQIDGAEGIASFLQHLFPAPQAFGCIEQVWNGIMITDTALLTLLGTQFLIRLMPLCIVLLIVWQHREIDREA